MKLNRIGLVFAIGVLLLIIGIAMPASAAENLTNASNESIDILPIDDQDEIIPLYINTEEYQQEYAYWIDYYRSVNQPSKERIKAYLTDETADSETRFNNVLSYIGRSEELLTYMDETKRTIDEITGSITYDLGFFNGLANLFGAGVNADNLPQNIAQGNALKDVYFERYNIYVQAEWELMFEDEE